MPQDLLTEAIEQRDHLARRLDAVKAELALANDECKDKQAIIERFMESERSACMLLEKAMWVIQAEDYPLVKEIAAFLNISTPWK